MFANLFFLALVAWPGVLIASSLLNMAIWGKFHWAEPFIIAPLGGIGIGAICWWSLQHGGGGAGETVRDVLLVMSQGVFGVARLLGWLKDPQAFFLISAGATLGCTVLAAALDHLASALGPRGVGAGLLGILLFLLKAPFCLVSSTVGLLIFLVGLIHSAATSGNRVGLAGGVTWEEWDRADSNYWATTVGATFHCWRGAVEDVFDHERHHTRQCIYLHDWMIPLWLVGEIGHAITGTNNGNPLEAVPYQIQGG